MPLAPPSKAARGRASKGRKIAFHVPLPAGKNALEKMVDKTDQVFARIYCKDSVGYFLGLPLANYRKLSALPASVGGQVPANAPRVIRAVADRTSARPYTLTLQPGTTVKQGVYKWFDGGAGSELQEIEMKTLQFYLPAYIPIWAILDWLAGKKNTYTIGENESAPLPDITFENYDKILALTTPNERTYALESILYANRVVAPNPDVIDEKGPDQAGP